MSFYEGLTLVASNFVRVACCRSASYIFRTKCCNLFGDGVGASHPSMPSYASTCLTHEVPSFCDVTLYAHI